MTETFVDLLYRGLPLGRRIKLTQVRPHNGYLEHPTPMPVGTAISVATDDGFVLDAVVTGVHEQVGGSEVAPGMRFAPTLASDQMTTWWKARVTLPEIDPPKAAAPPVVATRSPTTPPLTVRPRSHTVPNEPVTGDAPTAAAAPALEAAVSAIAPTASAPVVDARKTTVMPAIDQDLLAQLAKSPDEIERLHRKSGEYAVVDDGQRTTVMDAVDPAALGLEVSSSGSLGVIDDDGDEGGDDEPSPGDSAPIATTGSATKSKSKKRKKRR
jgi:hypothetical protein